eukprot:3729717-Pleurochrysis_carterae.AAC.1
MYKGSRTSALLPGPCWARIELSEQLTGIIWELTCVCEVVQYYYSTTESLGVNVLKLRGTCFLHTLDLMVPMLADSRDVPFENI